MKPELNGNIKIANKSLLKCGKVTNFENTETDQTVFKKKLKTDTYGECLVTTQFTMLV
jgi:hypothetical protein